jgi:hypothetical protein
MKAGKPARWRKGSGILLLATVSVGGLGSTPHARQFLASAHDVVDYYRVLGQARPNAGILERVALSLLLASADSARECAKKTTTSS